MNTIFSETLLIGTTSWLVAQGLKIIDGYFKEKRFDVRYFIRPGGMPSSHTALVTSLATSVGFLYGFNSVEFSISSVFAAIVMYDAAGVRRSVSRQSVIINRILQELKEKRPKDIQHDVRELIGHTPFQVFGGALLGFTIAVVWLLLDGGIKV